MEKNHLNIYLKKEFLHVDYNNILRTRLKLKELLENNNTLNLNLIFNLKKSFFKISNFKTIHIYFNNSFNTFLNNNAITKIILPQKTVDEIYIEAKNINFNSCKIIFSKKTVYGLLNIDITNCYLNKNFLNDIKNIKLNSIILRLKTNNKFNLNLDYLNIEKNFSIIGNENLYIKGKFKNTKYEYIKIYNSNIINNIFKNVKNIKHLTIEDTLSNSFKNKYLKFNTSFLKGLSEIGYKIKIEQLFLKLNSKIKYNNDIIISNVKNLKIKKFSPCKLFITNIKNVDFENLNANLTTMCNCKEILIVNSTINKLELNKCNNIILSNITSNSVFIDKFQETGIYNNEKNINKITIKHGKHAKIKDTLVNNICAYDIENFNLGLCSMEFSEQELKDFVNKSYSTVVLNKIEKLNFYLFYNYKLKNFEFLDINNLNIYTLFELENYELLNYFIKFIFNTKFENSKNIKIKSLKEFQYKSFYALVEKDEDPTKEIISLFQNLLGNGGIINNSNLKNQIKTLLIQLFLKQKINIEMIKNTKLKNEILFEKNEINKINKKFFNSLSKI